MRHFPQCFAVAVLPLLLFGSGCQWVPKSSLAACESQHRALTEQKNALLAENENLKNHSRRLGDEVIKAEEELAALDERAGLERRRLTNFEQEREALHKEVTGLLGGTGLPETLAAQLAEFSAKNPSLEFESRSGACRLDTDSLFEKGESQLRPDAERILDEFARLFKSSQSEGLRIVVVGHPDDRLTAKSEAGSKHGDKWHLATARALAVADRLKRAGVDENRLGVASFGSRSSSTSRATGRASAGRIELFVTGPGTPIVGWSDAPALFY